MPAKPTTTPMTARRGISPGTAHSPGTPQRGEPERTRRQRCRRRPSSARPSRNRTQGQDEDADHRRGQPLPSLRKRRARRHRPCEQGYARDHAAHADEEKGWEALDRRLGSCSTGAEEYVGPEQCEQYRANRSPRASAAATISARTGSRHYPRNAGRLRHPEGLHPVSLLPT